MNRWAWVRAGGIVASVAWIFPARLAAAWLNRAWAVPLLGAEILLSLPVWAAWAAILGKSETPARGFPGSPGSIRAFGGWFVTGFGVCAMAALWSLLDGRRQVAGVFPPYPGVRLTADLIVAAGLSWAMVALGYGRFLRRAVRAWGAVRAGAVTSLLFAAGHAGFADYSGLSAGGTVAAAASRGVTAFMGGALLCALIRKDGHDGGAVGALSGWLFAALGCAWVIEPALGAPALPEVFGDPVPASFGAAALSAALFLTGAVFMGAVRFPVLSSPSLKRAGAILMVVGAALLWRDVFRERIWPERWGVVVPGRVFRSGQIPAPGAEHILRRHGIRRVVDLTDRGGAEFDRAAERRVCRALGIRRIELPLSGDGQGDPAYYARAVYYLVDAVRDGTPTLIHCQAGTHRTGGVVAAYRLLVEKRSSEETVKELRAFGWRPGRDGVLAVYLDRHLPELAERLVRMKAISAAPGSFPKLVPPEADEPSLSGNRESGVRAAVQGRIEP